MSQETRDFAGPVCPRTGRPLTSTNRPKTSRVSVWLSLLTGGAALIWFLIRVIPKPSRAEYPCQRVAFPIASAFVAYLIGLSGAAVAMRRARRLLGETRYVMATLCVFAALACALLAGDASTTHVSAAFVPIDPANQPMGVARGVFPGRVTWAWDPNATTGATTWPATSSPFYWDDSHTNQAVVDELVSKCLRWLTDQSTDAAAWDALFRNFNAQRGKGDVGYAPGETIFIKTNHVQQRAHAWSVNYADIVPQIELSMLRQLVNQAGVPQAKIVIGDPSRFIADKSYNKCRAEFANVVYGEGTFYDPYNSQPGQAGRTPLTSTTLPVLRFSGTDDYDPAQPGVQLPIPDSHIPQVCVDADYIVNLGVMKGHSTASVTLSGKNWYGCFGEAPGGGAGAQHHLLVAETPEYGHYRLMVDMMGYKDLGGKTMLYVLDGLWGFQHHGSSSRPVKWTFPPFNTDYPSSVLMSQDPVAIDSVGVDFLRAQFGSNMGGAFLNGAADDYLHEAALAYGAPSETVYDPENDGIPCQSLGVHEHWNGSTDKKYTRNLGTGNGIELINHDLYPPTPTPSPTPKPTGAADWAIFE